MPDEAAAAEVPEQKHLKKSLKDANANVDDFQTLISIMVMKKQILNQKKIRKNQKMKQPNKAVFLFFMF